MSYPLLAAWYNWKGTIYCSFTKRTWSANELRYLSHQLSRKLKDLGIVEGKLVPMAISNTVAFPIVLFSCLEVECNPILLNPACPKPEIDEVSKLFDVKYFFHDFIPGISRLHREQEDIAFEFPIDEISICGINLDLNEIKDKYTLNEKGVILHSTSGTYGKSKYCLRPQTSAVAEAVNYIDCIDVLRHAVVTLTTPLHHAFAYGFGLISALLTNSNLRIYPVFNPRVLLKDIESNAGDILTIVPPMLSPLIAMAKESNYKMPPYVFYAGSVCSIPLFNRFQELFDTRLYQIYGTTESGGISSSYSQGNVLSGQGRAFNNIKVKIAKKEIYSSLGDIGEINITSNSMMAGYTHLDTNVNDFFTGDLGFQDKNGNIHLTGRIKDIINVGGNKIDPSEVEELLIKYSGVVDVSVYPGVIEESKEIIQAALVISSKLDIKDLTNYCYSHLTAYKVPLKFHFLEKIPRSVAGKCLKSQLPDYPEALRI